MSTGYENKTRKPLIYTTTIRVKIVGELFPFSPSVLMSATYILDTTKSLWLPIDYDILCFPQGTILGAFYYGYTAMQIPGGWLGQRFGGTRVFGICLGIASILTMLTPIAARTSVAALITLRVIEGLALVSEQITALLRQFTVSK